jgi:DNA polymerase III subunit beta
MQFTIDTSTFTAIAGSAKRIVDNRSTIPILNNLHVWTDAVANRVHVRASNLDLEISLSASGDVAKGGGTTIPAHTLHDVLRRLPAGSQATLEQPEPGKVIIKSGRSRFTLLTLPETDFPDIVADDLTTRFKIAAPVLLRLLEKSSFAASDDTKTRMYLCGVSLQFRNGQLHACGLNGAQLGYAQTDAPNGADTLPDIIIPGKTVDEIIGNISGKDGGVTVEASNTKIRVTFGETVITSKLIDAQFPDYPRVIPAGNDKIVIVDRAEFSASIERAATVTSERGRAVKLTAHNGTITLTVENPDAGSAHEECPCDYDGPEAMTGFNARYLLDILNTLASDTVTMKLADPGSPAVIIPREGSDLLCLLMPMRV